MSGTVVLRGIGALLLGLVGWQLSSAVPSHPTQPRDALVGAVVGLVMGAVFAPTLLTRPYNGLRKQVSKMPAHDFVIAVMGLIVGLLIAALLSYPLSFLPWWFGHVLPAVVAVLFAYLGVSLALLRGREFVRVMSKGGDSGTSEGSNRESNGHMLIDTSAIIDGRIADITHAGFLHGTLVVPRFVLKELQNIADSADGQRRARGRRGLDVLSRLQKDADATITISDLDVRDITDVDSKLLCLARDLHAPIVTNDYNLNRVAGLEGVRIMNVNELANALKAIVLPGEELTVRVVQEGKDPQQGVAFLDDGTMIVVEHGREYLHTDITVVVTRAIQTAAGRMIFAQPKSGVRA